MIKKSVLASAKNMSFAKTKDGKTLQNIGNGILRGGAPVFTDGKCIYGRMKRNETPTPTVVDEVEDGVPLLFWGTNCRIGYYSPTKKKVVFGTGKVDSKNFVFLTNDKDTFSFHKWDYFQHSGEWFFSDFGILMDFEVDNDGNMLYSNVGYFDVNRATPNNGAESSAIRNEYLADIYKHFLDKSFKPPGENHIRTNVVYTCVDFPCCVERDGSVSMWLLFFFDRYSYQRMEEGTITHNVTERFLGRVNFPNLRNPNNWSFEEYGYFLDHTTSHGAHIHRATNRKIDIEVPIQDGITWKGTVTVDMDSRTFDYIMLPQGCGEYGTLYDEAGNIILENVPFDERHAIDGDGHNPAIRNNAPNRGICRLNGAKKPEKEDDGYSKDEYIYLSGSNKTTKLFICKNQNAKEIFNKDMLCLNLRIRPLSKNKMRAFLRMNLKIE